ncbi:DUF3298 and DUF4163 domain-containing protein [Anaerosporobacter sp.]|uniref:DUF3298 and DUF4163 domain-containing protein n=1 Tax=Anaerosporobacter sp. TaxID=1872529 RepID=UPI00286F352E|nr:DUF3298 domain-containing protein [Anaerosporobacter sp.]
MKKIKCTIGIIIMSVGLIGCRSDYHMEADNAKQEVVELGGDLDSEDQKEPDKKEVVKKEIPYTRFEDCLYTWEDNANPALLNGYVKLSENVESKSYNNDVGAEVLNRKTTYLEGVDASQSKINKALEEANVRREKSLDKQVEDVLEMTKGDVAHEYILDDSEQVIRNDERMLTIIYSLYSYTGGAHPNLYKEVVSYNPVTGEELTIASITTNEEAFRQFVEDALHTYVTENKCENFLFGEEAYKEALKNWDKNWWINNGYLFVGFNTYDIAPYAAGPIVIPVDVTGAESYLSEYGKSLFQ